MVREVDGLAGAARAILLAAALLFIANAGYALAHEAAHAAVIEAAGGHVYTIYVNVFGLDAYTEHTPLPGIADLLLVNLAGLCMTSLLALVFTIAGKGLLSAFLAVRTVIYALDFAPGTDIATIYTALGPLALGISLLIFTAIFVGLNSFGNTASADARAEAAYNVAVRVSERISCAVESRASVIENLDLPERIDGYSYVVYPSEDGKAVYVLIGRERYSAPVIVQGDIRAEGFMISVPDTHGIEYDGSSRTITLSGRSAFGSKV
jgi:hypothetical protein